MNNDRGRPGRGDVKGVVVDIDGTLSGANRRIGLDAIAALRQVNDSGVVVMLASGNVLPVAYSLAVYCGFEGPIIAENGGIVSYRQAVWKLAEPDVPMKAFELLSRSMRVERLFTDRWRETEVGIKQEHDLEEVRRLVEGLDVDVQSTGWAIHLMHKGMDKMIGVRKACDIVGVDVREVAAIGDSENDERMLRECGWGLCVGNAPESTKRAATHVVDNESGDGVVEALRWLRLP